MRSRILPLVAVALALFLGAVAWFNARAAAHHRAEHRALTNRIQEHRSSLRHVEARLAAARAKPVLTEPTARALPSAPLPVPKRAAVPALPPNSLEKLANDPHLQNVKLASRRAQLAITFGPLYRSLGLTPDQVARFEQNLLRKEETNEDIIAAARARGTSINDPAVQKMLGESAQAYGSAQHELLGDQGMLQLSEHERLAMVREIVSGYSGAAAMSGAPFDGEQAERLTQVLDGASARYSKTNSPDVGKINWTQVTAQAVAFLSPAQLATIETTEPRGPRGMGGRFSAALNAAIDAAAKADEAALAPPANPN